MTSETIKCPLCEASMAHEIMKNGRRHIPDAKTYFWICTQCPGVLMEWEDEEDTKSFVKRFGQIEALGAVIEVGELFTKAKKITTQLKELEESIALLVGMPGHLALPSDWLVQAGKKGNASVQTLLQKHHDLEAELHALHEAKYVKVGKG